MKSLLNLVFSLIICSCGTNTSNNVISDQEKMQLLGKKIFFDMTLSSNQNQSCASCHDPLSGFADPDVAMSKPVSMGSQNNVFGNRNAPTSAYAFLTPGFTKTTTDTTTDGTTSNYIGGQFIDGRRENLVLQAKDPFLNSLEMNNFDESVVVNKVSAGNYAEEFIALFGEGAFDNVELAYNNIALAIEAFESSSEMNPFSSKFDKVMVGNTVFSESEQRGFDLFKGTKAKCANCHSIASNGPVLFTNHRYYNIGTPSNLNNPAVVADSSFVDKGLSENSAVINAGDAENELGKFRVPTLRNIAETAPYMHNGVYQTLEEVIDHYDGKMQFVTAEVDSINIANEVVFDDYNVLGLSVVDKEDLVNFMSTLSDE